MASVVRKTVFLSLLISTLLVASCAFSTGDFDRQLRSIVEPYSFSLLKWEITTLADELKQVFMPGEKVSGDEAQIVGEYFSLVGQIQVLELEIDVARPADGAYLASLQRQLEGLQQRRAALEDTAEEILEKQIEEVLIEEGIVNPLDKYLTLKFVFPPVNFEFEKPPHLLVISPRDRIELVRRILLIQNLSLDAKENIESQTDELGVSSLVIELGGFAAMYPTTIADNADMRYTMCTVVEEWLHQYLAFRPLGFLYLLDASGIRESPEIATISETLAGIVSKELGSKVYERYYGESYPEDSANETKGSEFDFSQEMTETRRMVEEYLAQGRIGEAEEFMEQKREYFATKGYYIRKLNQAYFAFHEIYAYDPASASPIDADLKALRGESPSLKEFLDKVAGMTSYEDLEKAIGH